MTSHNAMQLKPAAASPGRRRGIGNGLRTTTILTTLLLPVLSTPLWTSPAAAYGHCVEGVGPHGERQPCDDGGGSDSGWHHHEHSSGPSESSSSSSSTPRHTPGSRPFLGWLFAPHVVAGADGRWTTDPGYQFRNDDPGDLSAVWVPGRPYPGQFGVVSGAREGYWHLLDGYAWVNPNDQKDLRAVWQPGKAHSTMPNVEAAEQPDTWRPRPGYAWVKANPTSLADTGGVRWIPGLRHPTMPHVVASGTQDQWRTEAGYVWTNGQARSLSQTGGAVWAPATARRQLQAEVDSLRNKLHGDAQRLRNLRIGGNAEELEAWAHMSIEARRQFDEEASTAFFDAAKTVLLDHAMDGLRRYYGGLNPPAANARITQLKALGIDRWVPTGVSQAFFAILRDVAAHPDKPLEAEKVRQFVDAAERVESAYDASDAAKDGKFAEALMQTLSIGVGDTKLSLLVDDFRFTIAALYFNATLNISADEVERLTSVNADQLRYLKQIAAEMRQLGVNLHDDENDLRKVEKLVGPSAGNNA